MPASREIIISERAAGRIAAARAWLESQPYPCEVLVIASVKEAADDLVRAFAVSRGAMLGVHRLTLNRLVGVLAAEELAHADLAPADGLAAEAVAARAVFRLVPSGALAYFEPVLNRPGFSRALARTLIELRWNDIAVDELRALGGAGEAIAATLAQFDAELADAKLIDRAGMLKVATRAVLASQPPRFVGLPVLLLDPSVDSALDRDFIAALAARSPSILATTPAGDAPVQMLLEDALGVRATALSPTVNEDIAPSLERLQAHLFADTAPPERDVDETVTVVSAPGEMHECVEIARRIAAEARRGVPFDRIAVLLHDPVRYAPYLQEALARAGIPAYFARGTRRPEPGGRALLALLACAAENLSARRFAEYLSLAQVPDPGSPREDEPTISADAELVPASLESDLEVEGTATLVDNIDASDPVPVLDGTARAPWRWERLLVDAAVIGSAQRWKKRLAGLGNELKARRAEIADDDARAAGLERRILDLAHLGEVAMPILSMLDNDTAPRDANWGDWLKFLRGLVDLAIRDREPVLAALAGLEPMAAVGPVGLDEVRLVLNDRLGRLEAPRRVRRYGAVFVAPPNRARGMEFDVVIVPGLAERMFPRKLTEDPILSDSARARLSPHLARNEQRRDAERLALRIAAGAARERAMFSYPRVDLDQGRPRVPSFYALEILRAAEGRLPGFDELASRTAPQPTRRSHGRRGRTPPTRAMTRNSIWRCWTSWWTPIPRRRSAPRTICSAPMCILGERCARGRGAGSSDGRRRTGWSIRTRRRWRRWAGISCPRVHTRRPRCRISRHARIVFFCKLPIAWSRARNPRRSRRSIRSPAAVCLRRSNTKSCRRSESSTCCRSRRKTWRTRPRCSTSGSTKLPRDGMRISRRRSSACGATESTVSAPTCANGCGARPKIRNTGGPNGSNSASGCAIARRRIRIARRHRSQSRAG